MNVTKSFSLKFLLLFPIVLNCTFCHFTSVEINQDTEITTTVLQDIANEFFLKQNIEFEIISYFKVGLNTADVINSFISKLSPAICYKLRNEIDFSSMLHGVLFRPVFMFIESLENYQKVNQEICEVFRHSDQPIIHIIYIPDLTLERLKMALTSPYYFSGCRSLDVFSEGSLIHGFFVLNESDSVFVVTVEWFSDSKCNEAHLKVLNKFNKSTMTWASKLKYYEKFTTFHGCKLILAVPHVQHDGTCYFPSLYAKLLTDKSPVPKVIGYEVHGIVNEVFKLAARFLNYTVAYQIGHISPKIMSKFTSDEIMLLEINGTIQFPHLLFFLSYPVVLTRHVKYSHSVVYIESYYVATPAEPYTPYEKLLLPFDKWTWFMIILTFLVTFLIIFIVNLMSNKTRNLVYGFQVKNPFWNVVSIFFGISQTRLPVEHFPRFILTLFIAFCLIFRTCYQNKLFEFMTSEPRKPPPGSFAEMLDRNYTIFIDHPNPEDVGIAYAEAEM